MTTPDAFVRVRYTQVVDFIKPDVEGLVVAFLEGGADTIGHFQPPLMVQINSPTLERFKNPRLILVELLRKYRYHLATATTFGKFKQLDRLPVTDKNQTFTLLLIG